MGPFGVTGLSWVKVLLARSKRNTSLVVLPMLKLRAPPKMISSVARQRESTQICCGPQAIAQLPQCSGSLGSGVSQPLGERRSQSPKPASQASTRHVLVSQRTVAWVHMTFAEEKSYLRRLLSQKVIKAS